TAYLLQRYHQNRLPSIRPEDQPHLFAVLGSVSDFINPTKVLNREDFERWLRSSESELRKEIQSWLPEQLAAADRDSLLSELVAETLIPLDDALDFSGAVGDAVTDVAMTMDASTSGAVSS